MLRQAADDDVLRVVGILILVDQNISELLLIVLQHVGTVAQQDVGLQQQVVEIHRAVVLAALAVEVVDVAELGNLRPPVFGGVRRIGQIGARGDQRVLGLRDARGDHIGLVLVVGEVQLLDDRLDEVPGIGRIVDREVRRKADPLGVGAQDAGEDRVEGTHPNMASLTLGQMFWNHFDNTLTHLLRCFIRKCRCQNIFGFDSFLDHIGDARGEHARLARTGSGDDERRGVVGLDGGALGGVEPLQYR